MRYEINFSIEYPVELKTLGNKKELYEALQEIATSYNHTVAKTIKDEIFLLYPGLKNHLKEDRLGDYISEIVKNIFDSVNNAKAKNVDIDSIAIQVLISSTKNNIQIKIKDNGTGFANYEKSVEMNLSTYLDSKKNMPSKTNDKHEFGKYYLLGGQGIGLSRMNRELGEHATITIKNRKASGAYIKIVLPYTPTINEQLNLEDKFKSPKCFFFSKSQFTEDLNGELDELDQWLNEEGGEEESIKSKISFKSPNL